MRDHIMVNVVLPQLVIVAIEFLDRGVFDAAPDRGANGCGALIESTWR
jgi:hypothetical protein